MHNRPPVITLADRCISAVLGAVCGLPIGLFIYWTFGIFSNRYGLHAFDLSFKATMIDCVLACAVLGFVTGPQFGTAIDRILATLNAIEGGGWLDLPWWVNGILLILVASGFWWAFV
jgi:hypothetical protein